MSHEDLASRAGISRAGLGFIESHKRTPTLLTCLKIAEAMEVSLSDILARLARLSFAPRYAEGAACTKAIAGVRASRGVKRKGMGVCPVPWL